MVEIINESQVMEDVIDVPVEVDADEEAVELI